MFVVIVRLFYLTTIFPLNKTNKYSHYTSSRIMGIFIFIVHEKCFLSLYKKIYNNNIYFSLYKKMYNDNTFILYKEMYDFNEH